MLKIENLSKTYSTKKGAEVKALKNISAQFDETGLVFLLGKSGSGKSTLLNLIGGIDKPTSGEITIDSSVFSKFSERDYDSYRNTFVGFVFQEYNLVERETVGGSVSIALELQGKKPDRQLVEETLRKVELIGENGEILYESRINELSGGQKQRVAIARALIKNPRIILADEPTGALDSETGQQLYELLKTLAKEKLIIVVSHDRENAEKFGGRILELKDGDIVRDTGSTAMTETARQQNPPAAVFVCSKLPFKRALKMGAGALVTKKFRLILSVLLSVVTFVIFGFSVTANMADGNLAETKTLYDNEMRMALIRGDSVYDPGGAYESSIMGLRPEQVEVLKEYSFSTEPMAYYYIGDQTRHPLPVSANMGKTNYDYYGEDASLLFALGNDGTPYQKLGLSADISNAIELNPVSGLNDANLRADERFVSKELCFLPQNFEQIAITDLQADMFIKFGYRAADGTVVKINTPDDLIGKSLGKLTICGVFSTEQDRTLFQKYDRDPSAVFDNDYLKCLLYGTMNSLITNSFVCTGFQSHYQISDEGKYLIKLSGNINKDKAFFSRLNYKINTASWKMNCSFALISPYSHVTANAMLYKDVLMPVAMIAAAGFSIFSALLMMNFLLVSLDFKKKELGILRAIGASRKDVTLICLIESILIACIDFVVSAIGIAVICLVLNKFYHIALFQFGFLQVAALFLLCFGVAALATILPVLRMMKKKPVDIINNR